MPTSPYIGEIMLAAFNFAPVGYARCDGQLLPIAENEPLFQLIGTMYGGDGEQTFALPNLSGRIAMGSGQGPGLSNYAPGQAVGQESVTVAAAQLPVHSHTIDASNLAAAVRVRSAPGNQASPAGGFLAADGLPAFSNPSLTPRVDVIRAAHITELRTRINGYRSDVGMAPFSFTDATIVPGVSPVKAIHILQMRTALAEAYVQSGLTPPAYSDPALAAGDIPEAVHVTELRHAVAAVAGGPPTYSTAAPNATMNAAAITTAGAPTGATGGSQPHDNVQPVLVLDYYIALFGIFPPAG